MIAVNPRTNHPTLDEEMIAHSPVLMKGEEDEFSMWYQDSFLIDQSHIYNLFAQVFGNHTSLTYTKGLKFFEMGMKLILALSTIIWIPAMWII